ncbi:MAG: quercetin dioxygenase-like cupin family protein [Dinoroseobacter sp.]|jgi:quercetin dioxygenase-like cupin family protein
MARFSFFSIAIVMMLTGLSFEASAQKDAISSEVEKQNAMALGAKGPSETQGIESEVLAMIPLAREFDVMQAYSLRSRRITVAPGGVIAVHQHQSRPGILYMLEGVMTEHRNDSDTPLTRKQSDVSTEVHGLVHWWVNNSENRAVVYVVDIAATP